MICSILGLCSVLKQEQVLLTKAVMYPNVLQPVCGIDGWMPALFIDGGVNHLFQLTQRLSYNVNVRDLQEIQLYVGIEILILITSIFGLWSGTEENK